MGKLLTGSENDSGDVNLTPNSKSHILSIKSGETIRLHQSGSTKDELMK